MKKEMHIFFPISKKYAYFFPNWRKIYKIANNLQNFYINQNNINHEGGWGQKNEFQIEYTPLN